MPHHVGIIVSTSLLFHILCGIVVGDPVSSIVCSLFGTDEEYSTQITYLYSKANCRDVNCTAHDGYYDGSCTSLLCTTDHAVANLLTIGVPDNITVRNLQSYYAQLCGAVGGQCTPHLGVDALRCRFDKCANTLPTPKIDTWILSMYIVLTTIAGIQSFKIDYLNPNMYRTGTTSKSGVQQMRF